MKTVIFFAIIIAGAGYYFYSKQSIDLPLAITDPYYAEMTIKQKVQSYDLTVKVYGEASSSADCEIRSKISLQEIIEECKECNVIDYQCHADMPAAAQKLFEKEQTHLAYITMDRGKSDERNVRIIVWGITKDQSKQFCNIMIPIVKKKYSGSVACVPALERS